MGQPRWCGVQYGFREIDMLNFGEIKKSAIAALAAILVSATMVSAAIGPVQIAAAQSVAAQA